MRNRLAVLTPMDRVLLLLAAAVLALAAYMAYSYTNAINQQDEGETKLRRNTAELGRLREATDIPQLQGELTKVKASLSSLKLPRLETATAVATAIVNEADRESLALRELRTSQSLQKFGGRDYFLIRYSFVVSGDFPSLIQFIDGLEQIPVNSVALERLVTEAKGGKIWESRVDLLVYFERTPQ
ncbi:MAG: hypothetical protein HY687_01050 [Chloroflexi bacterium]|nr:hypothetical protein [Chloroflexota bacterium]